MENSIPIHEFTHGLSTRLTGGADDVSCLRATEPKGLGDGWSDAMALFIQYSSKDSRNGSIALGTWTRNDQRGARNYPYSSRMTVNPLRCAIFFTLIYRHLLIQRLLQILT